MKKILLMAIVALITFPVIVTEAHAQKKKTETVVFDTGITCNNCKKKIEDNLPFEKGVKDLSVDVPSKKVTVVYDPSRTNAEDIRKAIEKLGYKAVLEKPADDKKEKK